MHLNVVNAMFSNNAVCSMRSYDLRRSMRINSTSVFNSMLLLRMDSAIINASDVRRSLLNQKFGEAVVFV